MGGRGWRVLRQALLEGRLAEEADCRAASASAGFGLVPCFVDPPAFAQSQYERATYHVPLPPCEAAQAQGGQAQGGQAQGGQAQGGQAQGGQAQGGQAQGGQAQGGQAQQGQAREEQGQEEAQEEQGEGGVGVRCACGARRCVALAVRRRAAARARITARELAAADNTGNVRVWEAELLLARLVASGRWAASGRGGRVLELGAGMAGLAGLAAAAALAPAHVLLTDGDAAAAANLRFCVHLNDAALAGAAAEGRLAAAHLPWAEAAQRLGPAQAASFHLALLADCLFLEQHHAALLEALAWALGPGGEVLGLAPGRGGSRARFLAAAAATGAFALEADEERYDEELWACHERLLAGDPSYEPDRHYPRLFVLRRTNAPAAH